MKNQILPAIHDRFINQSIARLIAWPFVPIICTLACLALSPLSWAVDPPPDGGYPNQNTAEGDSALFSLTSGINNTAIGFQALYSNTTANSNTTGPLGR